MKPLTVKFSPVRCHFLPLISICYRQKLVHKEPNTILFLQVIYIYIYVCVCVCVCVCVY